MSDVLLHFTGRNKPDKSAFQALESICTKSELWLSYCPTFKEEKFQKKVWMTCLTDMPLAQCKVHAINFGRCAVGFNLEKLKSYGANPVFYATEEHYDRIRNLSTLVDRMKELEKAREWKEDFEPYQFIEDETLSLMVLSGLLQEYSYKRDDQRNQHKQREWRIIFDALPFAGGYTYQSPGMSCFQIVEGNQSIRFMRFDENDIEYIVVPESLKKNGEDLGHRISKPCKILEEELADD